MPRRPKDWLLDERLLQSQKLASIGQMAAGIAHEINNPLAVIRQEAEWLLKLLHQADAHTPPDLEELRASARLIIEQVDRCAGITRNLLDFARKRPPVIQGVQLNKVIEDMTRLVEKEAKNLDIQIVRDYAPDLPAIYSDAPQLRQVILNLLTNATHAIGRGGAITIRTGQPEPDMVEMAIKDSGCGIPPENLPRLFDPFFTTKAEGQGTGLGLAISHGIIQRLGGEILVDSIVGQGATFTLRLPLRPDVEALLNDQSQGFIG